VSAKLKNQGRDEGMMNLLKEATTEELQNEIIKRGKKIPKSIDNPDFDFLKECCLDYLVTINDSDTCDNEIEDDKSAIYEAALITIYGKDIWKWIDLQDMIYRR
jgi:hypothetical protein